MEIAGFIASQFAYGRVGQVTGFLQRLFGRITESPEGGPYGFVTEGNFSSLGDLYYRFQKGEDIIEVFEALHRICGRFGGIGRMIEHYYEGDFRQALWRARLDIINGGDDLLFFFPKRAPASPLKRWSLYARWMVRKDEIDFGLWRFIDRASLTIPLDANVFKIGRCQGWTDRKAPDWKAACQITAKLKEHAPHDPLKYDFFLCHVVGMDGGCTGGKSAICREGCLLR